MKLEQFVVENYRSIRKVDWQLGNLTIVIGPNDSGKSNLLLALRMFLEGATPRTEDFHMERREHLIRMEGTFSGLSPTETAALEARLINGRLYLRRAFTYDSTEGTVQGKTEIMRQEPKDPDLKPSRLEANKAQLKQIVEAHGLPPYFLSPAGNVTHESFRSGLDRYLKEQSASIEWDEPVWIPGDSVWKVARPYLPEIQYVPAVQELRRELGGKTPFEELLKAVLERILAGSPEIGPLRQMAEKVTKLFTRTGGDDARLSELRDFESHLTDLLRQGLPAARVEVELIPPRVEGMLGQGATLYVDDGFRTTADMKGHGLQRELMFAILRAYVGMRGGAEHRTLLFAIEEPELYLHPPAQRRFARVLAQIATEDQVVACTHSPIFVDMESYRSLCVVQKSTAEDGTRLHQCLHELFPGDLRAQFKMAVEYDPERSEMFFARKVLLVEGDTEKVAFPIVSSKMGVDLNERSVAIVEVNGKSNLPLFMRILSAFHVPHVVVYDADTGKQDEAFNAVIESEASKLTTLVKLDPDFEHEAGISTNQVQRLGKRLAAVKLLNSLSAGQTPRRLVEAIEFVAG